MVGGGRIEVYRKNRTLEVMGERRGEGRKRKDGRVLTSLENFLENNF